MNNQDSISLYGIADEFEQLDQMLEATGGEITEEWEAQQAMLLEMMVRKIDGLCGYVRKLEDMMDAADKQIAQLQKFKSSKATKLDNLDHYVRLCLQKLGKDKFVGDMYEAKQNTPGKSLYVDPTADIPPEFIYIPKPVPQVMKKELKDAVATGKVKIEGVRIVEGVPSIKYCLRTESRKKKEKTNATESTSEPTQSGSDAAAPAGTETANAAAVNQH